MNAGYDRREGELTKRARLGDEAALGTLVDSYAAALIGYIYRLTGDFHQAEDLAQETFLRAFDNLDKFDSHRPFRPWLLKIGRNLALNYLSSRTGKERRESQSIEALPGIRAAGSPDEMLELSERKKGIEKILSLLPVHFREILHLRYMEGLEYETIASELNLPLGTVKTWLHRAKEAFLKEAESAGIVF